MTTTNKPTAKATKTAPVAVIKGTAAVSKALSEQLLAPAKPKATKKATTTVSTRNASVEVPTAEVEAMVANAKKATKKATPAKATPAPKPPKQEMEKVSVMVSTETLDRLEALAKDAGINRGQLVRNILAQHCGLSS